MLFTTFTKNLTADISRNLKKICTREEYLKIDVINLDDWVAEYVKENGIPYDVMYGMPITNLWKEACSKSPLGLDPSVYKNEWEQVVMPQKILTYEQYARADRSRCGRKLDAVQRRQFWDVFDRYITLMKEHKICDNDYAMILCEDYISQKYGAAPLYRHIIVDEAQDFGDCAYRLIRAMGGKEHRNDIYITGDTRQSIYGKQAVLSKCGINVAGKGETLKINYRTTEEIRERASSVVDGIAFTDMDKGVLRRDASVSLTHGPVPAQHNFASYDEEVWFILSEIQKLKSEGTDLKDICVATLEKKTVGKYADTFTGKGFSVWNLNDPMPKGADKNTLRFATMHRIKGLEFKYVFLCSMNDGVIPPGTYRTYHAKNLDEATIERMITNDRSLLYVAMTRARQGVYLTSYGAPSELLPGQQDSSST